MRIRGVEGNGGVDNERRSRKDEKTFQEYLHEAMARERTKEVSMNVRLATLIATGETVMIRGLAMTVGDRAAYRCVKVQIVNGELHLGMGIIREFRDLENFRDQFFAVIQY